MRYNEYLKQGLPIASGSVEGACKNLVKDRMERSGMRWTKDMAEAMLKMRAIYLSGDFEDYWSFHIQKDQERLYPKGRWRPVLAVVQKYPRPNEFSIFSLFPLFPLLHFIWLNSYK